MKKSNLALAVKGAIQDKRGSEAVEMVYSTAATIVLILCAMLILTFAVQVNAVSYAAKRVARYVEVGGVAQQADLNNLLDELLPNRSDIGARVTVECDNWYNAPARKIQLREGFTVIVTANYNVTLANPGGGSQPLSWTLPIRAKVNGQSEIYWKGR